MTTPRSRGMDRLSSVYNNVYHNTGNIGYGTVRSHDAGIRNVTTEALAYMPARIVLRNGQRILRACATLQAKIEGWS